VADTRVSSTAHWSTRGAGGRERRATLARVGLDAESKGGSQERELARTRFTDRSTFQQVIRFDAKPK